MDHIFVFLTLFIALILFVWGKFRHDFVALLTLFFLAVIGIIPHVDAFSGFGHPAVVTVAAVLIIGKALEYSGLINIISKWITLSGSNINLQLLLLCLMVAVSSAFMNNVGALAIFMPIALSIAKKNKIPSSYMLMPIAFASLLGGMTTLIGTPPNIIISTFRSDELGEAYGMFDFSLVGIGLMLTGILFIAFLGWRLIPKRPALKSETELFKIDDYITEVLVVKDSKMIGKTVAELVQLSKVDIQILGIVRNNKRIHAPDEKEEFLENDIIIIETDTDSLTSFIDDSGLQLVGGKKFRTDAVGSKNISIAEAIVMADSPLIGQTTAGIRMRSRYGINLLAVSRKHEKIHRRLDHVIFQNGDVLMIQGRTHLLNDTLLTMGCLPLAQRGLRIGYEKNVALCLGLFIISIGLVVSGLLPVHIAFPLAAVGMVLTGALPVKNMYTSIDWPVIVLLGAMLPVGQALETSGGASIIAQLILDMGSDYPAWFMLSLVLIVTMFLSDLINNAATVVLMAPIGMAVARGIGVSVDPFLMAVAIGASCAFLTPIGHQSNTLVMGPGGYKFSDYWRMGLPLEFIIVVLGVPLIMYFWPM